jgi:uncharacterized membrane protein YkvA (DUF1232 family)
MIANLKKHAIFLKNETYALYFAARDPRVPWYAKAFMGLVLAYALSPIDLIPDFIPIIGYLDDLIIVPLGIALSLKMIPTQVMVEARKKVEDFAGEGKSIGRIGAIIVISIWVLFLALVIWLIIRIVLRKTGVNLR